MLCAYCPHIIVPDVWKSCFWKIEVFLYHIFSSQQKRTKTHFCGPFQSWWLLGPKRKKVRAAMKASFKGTWIENGEKKKKKSSFVEANTNKDRFWNDPKLYFVWLENFILQWCFVSHNKIRNCFRSFFTNSINIFPFLIVQTAFSWHGKI